jgi:hypothetical protein
VHGGTPIKLDISIQNLGWFVLSPDNRHFVFGASDEGKNNGELWVLENFLPKK